MSQRLAICTIITRNRMAWARTLAESFNKFHPNGQCFTLLLDDVDKSIEEHQEPFQLVHLAELELPDREQMLFKYTPFELCCALKPFVLEYLLQQHQAERCFYFDSDMMFCAPMNQVISELDTADVLLTPHLEQDLPRDGKKPDDAHVMLSGVFNAGFVGVKNSEEGLRFLDWWAGKLKNGCIEDHFNGRFVDQKYLDMVVGMFKNVGILRDPGCNAAYWNLHSRKITRQNGSWQANGKPLVFYHFSDYRIDRPDEMSGHQNRFGLENMPELKSLFDHYRTCVLANGEEVCRTWDYSFGRYKNGRQIKPWTRRAFLLHRDSQPPFDPFDSSQHTMRFRLQSAYQACLMAFNRFVHKARRFF